MNTTNNFLPYGPYILKGEDADNDGGDDNTSNTHRTITAAAATKTVIM